MPSKRRRRTLAAAAAAEAAAAAGPPRFANGFPQFVERKMPTIYCRSTIELTSDSLELGLAPGGRVYRVLDPDPTAGDALTDGRRKAVLDAAAERSALSRFKVCVIFAAGNAVYFDPDGTRTQSASAPRRGLDLGEVTDFRGRSSTDN